MNLHYALRALEDEEAAQRAVAVRPSAQELDEVLLRQLAIKYNLSNPAADDFTRLLNKRAGRNARLTEATARECEREYTTPGDYHA